MSIQIRVGDALETLKHLDTASVDCCVTSPEYFIGGDRDARAAYLYGLWQVFYELHRVLRDDGTFWLVMNDWRDGTGALHLDNCEAIPKRWWLQSEIIWVRYNAQPTSAKRPDDIHEKVYLLTKGRDYYFDGRRFGPDCRPTWDGGLRNVWRIPEDEYWQFLQWRAAHIEVPSQPNNVWDVGHYGALPAELAARCIMAGCKPAGTVLDPFFGTGTTGIVAARLGRDCIGIDRTMDLAQMSRRSIEEAGELSARVEMDVR